MSPRLLSLGLACLAVLTACGPSSAPEVVDFKVIRRGNVRSYPEEKRRMGPVPRGELLTGTGMFDSASLRGKVVVVNFWASWCGPCRDEQPILRSLAQDYQPKGVAFVGVDTRRDQRAAALSFLDEFSIWDGSGEPVYPSIYDPRSRNAYAYRLFFMPATFVLDERSRIAGVVAGGLPDERSLADLLDKELA